MPSYSSILATCVVCTALGVSASVLVGAGTKAEVPSGPPKGYDLEPAFTEEFDGTTVDAKRWNFNFGHPKTDWPTAAKRSLYGNAERQIYFDPRYLGLRIDPFRVDKGVLTISAMPLDARAQAKVLEDVAREPPNIRSTPLSKVSYSSGVITTRGRYAQKYGYFEMRARWSGGKGLWPCFWLLPASGRWPPEIDILEAHGDKPRTAYQSVHSTLHPAITRTVSTPSSTEEFHSYGVLWTPTTLDYYIDGVKTSSIPTSGDLTEPMYIIANLAIGGHWPGDPDAGTKFPATMDIDYIRAWRFKTQP